MYQYITESLKNISNALENKTEIDIKQELQQILQKVDVGDDCSDLNELYQKFYNILLDHDILVEMEAGKEVKTKTGRYLLNMVSIEYIYEGKTKTMTFAVKIVDDDGMCHIELAFK